MSLDVYLKVIAPTTIYQDNITHNLGKMAREAGIYQHLWRPEELGIKRAGELIDALRAGLELLESDPERFRKLNPENGWGSYDGLCRFVYSYLSACRENPDADIEANR